MKRIRTPFTIDMIRAILAGRKSQTRRALNPQPAGSIPAPDRDSYPREGMVINGVACIRYTGGEMQNIPLRCGRPGDVMHVLESHIITAYEERTGGQVFVQGTYCADDTRLDAVLTPRESALFLARQRKTGVVVPGRFMYDSLVRLKLPITDVRVKLLGDISQEDAKAEGVEVVKHVAGMPLYRMNWGPMHSRADEIDVATTCPVESYMRLWNQIYPDLNMRTHYGLWVSVTIFEPCAAAGKEASV